MWNVRGRIGFVGQRVHRLRKEGNYAWRSRCGYYVSADSYFESTMPVDCKACLAEMKRSPEVSK